MELPGFGSIASSIRSKHGKQLPRRWKQPPSIRMYLSSRWEFCKLSRFPGQTLPGSSLWITNLASQIEMITNSVKLIECPRDAWQGLKGMIPLDVKVNYLKTLISAGFKHIDAVSFVSPNAVPQMADSEEVLKELDPPDDVEIIGIIVNEKGAQRAIKTNAVRTLGFPYSVSPTFLSKNQRQTPEESLDEL